MKTNIKVLAAGFVALAFSVSSNANLSILDSFEYTDNYYPSDTTDYQNVFVLYLLTSSCKEGTLIQKFSF